MYLKKKEQLQILDAINAAELQTSGEIRVHVEGICEEDNPLDRAAWLFGELGMEKTARRNGVLIYLALKSHRIAIIGDCGINSKVESNFWDSTLQAMQQLLTQGRTVEAIEQGVRLVGEQMKSLFPYEVEDINELPDVISFGK
ncbi:MAG: TPM domain-containing protein [Bacteroidales bacterium]|nr:TPM domain-containing protein [Bacteroidales bacterium]